MHANRDLRTDVLLLMYVLSTAFPSAAAAQVLPKSLEGFEQTFPAMGTTVTIAAFSSQPAQVDRAFREARGEIQRLESILTDYDDDSEVSHMNAKLSKGSTVRVGNEVWDVLAASAQWNKISSGAFDPSIGALTRLWRTARRTGAIPPDDRVAAALAVSGWKHLKLDVRERTVASDCPGLLLDFGAIAKGYIVDRAFSILEGHGLRSIMINAGGDLRCGEPPPNRIGWRIGIASLRAGGPPMRVVLLSNAAIATSGDLWQYSLINGQRRSHILNPTDGYGVLGPLSVSAIAETAMEADAAATALSVLGRREGCFLAESLPRIDALAISLSEPDNSVVYTVTSQFWR